MEKKIPVRLLILAAAIVAPALIDTKDQYPHVRPVEEISSDELVATTRAENYCAHQKSDQAKTTQNS